MVHPCGLCQVVNESVYITPPGDTGHIRPVKNAVETKALKMFNWDFKELPWTWDYMITGKLLQIVQAKTKTYSKFSG